MSEKARRNLTRAIVGVAIVALIVFAYYRKTEIPRLVDRIANGTPAERLDAVKRLIAKEKLAEAMEEASRPAQYNCVAALVQIGDHQAMAQMLEAKWDFDLPIETWCQTILVTWGDSAVGPLIEALQNKDGHIRGASLVALSKIGEAAKPPLLELTGAWDLYVRDAVRDTCAKADMAPLIRDELIEIVKESEPRPGETPAKHIRRRDTAVRALEAMKVPAFEVLVKLLRHADPDPAFGAELRGQAALSLGRIADQTKDSPIAVADAITVIDDLIEALGDPDWTVQRRAAAALGPVCKVKAEPEDPAERQELARPIDPLIALLNAPQPDVRAAAAESLGLIGTVRAAAPLGAALADDTRRAGAGPEIALAIERIGGPPAVKTLSASLQHGDPDVRELATATLANIGGPASPRPLAERLSVSTEQAVRVRRVAAGALRNIAEGAYAESGAADVRAAMQSVLPALAGALADGDWHVYVAARDTLARVGQPAVSQLINAMTIGDDRVSYTATESLAKIGRQAVPQLLRTITERPESDVARWAAIALGDIGSPAVPSLMRALADSSLSVAARSNAARALGLSRDLRAAEALLAATRDPVADVRVQAVRSLADLRGVEGEKKEGESAVIAALADDDAAVREMAMRVLEDWPGVTANEGLVAKLGPNSPKNTRRRAAVVIAYHLRAGMLLGMGAERTAEEAKLPERVASLLQTTLSDETESPPLRHHALELFGSVAAVDRVDKETIKDPPSVDIEQFISAEDTELTHAACKALAGVGARISREIMREARLGLTPEPSQAATILARHLEAPERPDLAAWYALSLAEIRETAVKSLVDPRDPDDRTAEPAGLLMESEVPSWEQLSDAESRPTKLWAAAVLGRIGKPAVNALFDSRTKFAGARGTRSQAMERLREIFDNFDLFVFHEGAITDAVGDDGKLASEELRTLQQFNNRGSVLSLDSVQEDAETIWRLTRELRWVHAAMLATRDTLARDYVENVGDFDVLPEAEYERVEEAMDELARLKVAEW
ncbi:MAG: HEAT repeat domain-containing protein [Armatimonadota bacterium]